MPGQIPWGKDEKEKQAFLNRSRRRRNIGRFGLAAATLFLFAFGWLGYSQYQRFDAQTYLKDNSYPPELYGWQHQLKTLKLRGDFDVQRFSWLNSNALEELEIKVKPSSNSLDGLTALARCSSLKKLTLHLSRSQVRDLGPLEKLTSLTQLNLDLGSSRVSDLGPLEKLTSLTQLNLDLDDNRVSDLTPLRKLTSLTQLSLNLSDSQVGDLSLLERLDSLQTLVLYADSTPRMSLHAIPRSVTHLEF